MARGGTRRSIDRYITVATGEMAREPKTHLLIVSKYVCMYVCMYGHHIQQIMDPPVKFANPARGQLNRKNKYSPIPVRA